MHIVQHFLGYVSPHLLITGMPEQTHADHNISGQGQPLLGFQKSVPEPGAAAKSNDFILSDHGFSPLSETKSKQAKQGQILIQRRRFHEMSSLIGLLFLQGDADIAELPACFVFPVVFLITFGHIGTGAGAQKRQGQDSRQEKRFFIPFPSLGAYRPLCCILFWVTGIS
jgi:hypothetical protein